MLVWEAASKRSFETSAQLWLPRAIFLQTGSADRRRVEFSSSCVMPSVGALAGCKKLPRGLFLGRFWALYAIRKISGERGLEFYHSPLRATG